MSSVASYPVVKPASTDTVLGMQGGAVKRFDLRADSVQKTGDYTLAAADDGKTIYANSASQITITLPNNLPVDFGVTIWQVNTGQVVLAAASGATLRNRAGHTKSAGRWAALAVTVGSQGGNFTAGGTGTTGEWLLSGDTAA